MVESKPVDRVMLEWEEPSDKPASMKVDCYDSMSMHLSLYVNVLNDDAIAQRITNGMLKQATVMESM